MGLRIRHSFLYPRWGPLPFQPTHVTDNIGQWRALPNQWRQFVANLWRAPVPGAGPCDRLAARLCFGGTGIERRTAVSTGAQGPESGGGIAVVIPCYRETAHILDVIERIGPGVAQVIVVDDACPDGTGDLVERDCTDPRVRVIRHIANKGVGGATLTGYQAAIAAGAEIIVKLDGDGQMDPDLIPVLVAPIQRGQADYAKGNRFFQLDDIAGMPTVRVLGNLGLSFASKLSSGYWDVFDPTNGFTAIHAKVAALLPFAKISTGFFFESDMLFRLNITRAVAVDVPMQAKYGGEHSSLRIRRVFLEFLGRHLVNTGKRIFYSYFLRDFNFASIELVLGTLLVAFGILFGLIRWADSMGSGVPATAGTVILAALPVIIGTQMLLGFLNHDSRNMPRNPLHLWL
ncbi:MAG: glycosyltransferase family 2 protein [Hyphomicrobiales bacterium]|nr:glycosyltransferase family 2 protein [Hyphomicrobiales bacterium]MCP5370778.1 glycosyltransferase family 2 protein [Hyphomicrobiales bacterium]